MEESANELLKKHLNVTAELRKAFIKFEANQKLHKAIKSELRSSTSLICELSDQVHYKRNILFNGIVQELFKQTK